MGDYHHGDLANALLQSARIVLDEKGIHGISLRACASHAGVSHAAPAHHFKSLRGLLTELTVIAYDLFTTALQTQHKHVIHEPHKCRLQKVCQAYVDFSIKEPRLFELMFSSIPLDFENPRLKSSSGKAYQQLIDIVHPLFDAKKMDKGRREQTEILVWSLVHGYACLLMNERERYGSECSDTAKETLPDFGLLVELLQ